MTAPNITQIPAFPVPAQAEHMGVTMRDWFAAMAMQGIVSKGLEVQGDRVRSESAKAQEMATRAYRLADAMTILRERDLS